MSERELRCDTYQLAEGQSTEFITKGGQTVDAQVAMIRDVPEDDQEQLVLKDCPVDLAAQEGAKRGNAVVCGQCPVCHHFVATNASLPNEF